MQMGTFKLKNGWKINTYGDYDKDGWKVPNRSAMPWEKNNFREAFERSPPMVISWYPDRGSAGAERSLLLTLLLMIDLFRLLAYSD